MQTICVLAPPRHQVALQHGVIAGRRGFGSIFVVASGNGGQNEDDCNYDGYANSIYTVTIGEPRGGWGEMGACSMFQRVKKNLVQWVGLRL